MCSIKEGGRHAQGCGAGVPDGEVAEDQEQNAAAAGLQGKRGAAGVCENRGETEHRVESAATGDHNLRGGAVFFELHHAAGNAVRASGAQPQSAEEIFRIVHRLLANLPDHVRKGALTTSHANVRQIVFPHMDSSYRVEAASENAGRGLTIQNLHCSEVSRWPGDAAATLAALRAAVPPDGEIVLESTANGAGGCFYEEWQRAEQMGYSRHFFPWWWEPSYKRPAEIVELTDDELELMAEHELTAEQIAFRREVRANFGRRAKEEYAEDAESCFLASGDCIFDVEVIEQRLKEPLHAIKDRGQRKAAGVLCQRKTDKEYIIGVDPAGGGSDGDYACAQVIERAIGHAVRRVARTLYAGRAGGAGGDAGARVQQRAGGGGTKQSRPCGAELTWR